MHTSATSQLALQGRLPCISGSIYALVVLFQSRQIDLNSLSCRVESSVKCLIYSYPSNRNAQSSRDTGSYVQRNPIESCVSLHFQQLLLSRRSPSHAEVRPSTLSSCTANLEPNTAFCTRQAGLCLHMIMSSRIVFERLSYRPDHLRYNPK